MSNADAIIAAVKSKDANRVTELLAQDPGLVNTPTPDGSLVLTAVFYGAGEVLEVLLQAGPDLDIFSAAAAGLTGRAAALLDRQPDLVNRLSIDGNRPLGLAAFFGHRETVELLLAYGANVNAMSESKVSFVPSNTALHAATAGSNPHSVAPVLVAAGAHINAADSNGATPLHNAAFRGDVPTGEVLLAHDATVDVRRNDDKSPLAVALEGGHHEFAQLLRRHGASA